MITPKEIKDKTMTSEKKNSSKNNFFAFYVGRPLSYVLTVPFLYTKLTPNQISIISVFPSIVGFFLLGLGRCLPVLLIGWLCFFIWNLFDGVDGNVARYRDQATPLGDVYDALSGYVATMLSFLACGWAAAHQVGVLSHFVAIPAETFLVLGALSSIFTIFPRLVMHRAITSLKDEDAMAGLTQKSEYGLVRVVALNLTSTSGFVQVLMLIAILFHMLDIFTIGYCVLNFVIMMVSLRDVFSVKR